MLAQAAVVRNNKILLVKQKVKRGDIVWNFPGGGVEEGESFEDACIREVKEETGYDVKIIHLLYKGIDKQSFYCEVVKGDLLVEDDEDILDVRWVDLFDEKYFDSYSYPLVKMVRNQLGGKENGSRRNI